MRQRVRWNHSSILTRTIDQTALVLDDGHADDPEFSFLVIGDSGSGPHTNYHPQRRIAEQMLPHLETCRFLLHTGDVVYPVGSHEQYFSNFIEPYREWLKHGDRPHTIAYDQMVFTHPFLPVMGNHDYYNLPRLYSLFAKVLHPAKQLLGDSLSNSIGVYGSTTGDTYARAFIDYLQRFESTMALDQHLSQHYDALSDMGRCLRYQPGTFTRLPNRYYTFRYGGIDFFALDSSTFNEPSSLPLGNGDSIERRSPKTWQSQTLLLKRQAIAQEEQQIRSEAAQLDPHNPEDLERMDDLQAKLEQLEEIKLDIHKQLQVSDMTAVDVEQLRWLQQRLIASWHNPAVRGRVIYFHHPPYVTEATKWPQAQTLAVRYHLRWVLDGVATALGDRATDQPLVDLILSGHAHCMEHLQTGETGHADAHLNWVICGGSGFSLRRQREEGPMIEERHPGTILEPSVGTQYGASNDIHNDSTEWRDVARSKFYVGLTGHRTERKRPYSFLRIDVQPGTPPKFVLRPHVSERYHRQWREFTLDPTII